MFFFLFSDGKIKSGIIDDKAKRRLLEMIELQFNFSRQSKFVIQSFAEFLLSSIFNGSKGKQLKEAFVRLEF